MGAAAAPPGIGGAASRYRGGRGLEVGARASRPRLRGRVRARGLAASAAGSAAALGGPALGSGAWLRLRLEPAGSGCWAWLSVEDKKIHTRTAEPETHLSRADCKLTINISYPISSHN
jgi:hypothetical protein